MSDEHTNQAEEKHYVYIIHGFRTRATWLPELQRDLHAALNGQVESSAYYYGGFSLGQFLLRSKFAEAHVVRISQKLEELTRKGYKTTVMAHSFGTHLLYEALKEDPNIKLRNVILCGSILGHYAPLDAMKGNQIDGTVYNFCGRRDPVPALAELSSRSFSATGTEGLFNLVTRNSFHDIGHSDFLKPAFWNLHWIPLLKGAPFKPQTAKLLPWYVKLLLNVSNHRLPTFLFTLVLVGTLIYLADTVINLRTVWACRFLDCYIDRVLTVKDYNNSIRRKDGYLYFNETLTAYNLNHDRDIVTYPYSPQINANDPEVIDILDKNKVVEQRTDSTGRRYYPLMAKNRLAAFVAKYKYENYEEVPGGVAYTASMLTRTVNIEVRMPQGVKIKEIYDGQREGLFLLERSDPKLKWSVSRRSYNCEFGSDNRIFCEDVWLRPNERLLYCFSLVNWRQQGETMTADKEECDSYRKQVLNALGAK
jgi:hypothetical protein